MVVVLRVSACLYTEHEQKIHLCRKPQMNSIEHQVLTMTVHIGITGMRFSLHCEIYAAVTESNGVDL
jgi:hypothetical protein